MGENVIDRLTKYSKETTHENGVCCTHFGSMECSRVTATAPAAAHGKKRRGAVSLPTRTLD